MKIKVLCREIGLAALATLIAAIAVNDLLLVLAAAQTQTGPTVETVAVSLAASLAVADLLWCFDRRDPKHRVVFQLVFVSSCIKKFIRILS